MHGFHTPWPLFLAIIAGYMVLSLFVLGGKKLYFEPYEEKPADKPPVAPPATPTPPAE